MGEIYYSFAEHNNRVRKQEGLFYKAIIKMMNEKGFGKSYQNAKTFTSQLEQPKYVIDDIVLIVNVDDWERDKNKIGQAVKIIEIDNSDPNKPLIYKVQLHPGFSYWIGEKNIEKV